jgi:hypothetical protein
MVEYRFNASEWVKLSPGERVKRCWILAHEATQLALTAEKKEIKRGYLELAAQRETLARNIERGER